MYTTNKEYRKAIRNFCRMNCQDENLGLDIDDESKDEMLFDTLASKNMMDFIFERTKDHPLWQNLYDKAAGKFLSVNRDIGLSVLFSYDFFWDFNHCWNYYLKSLEEPTIEKFDESYEFYQSLDSKL